MELWIPLLLASANRWTSAFKMEDVAAYLPLLRSVEPRACPPNELWQPCSTNCSDCARRGSCGGDCRPACDCLPRYFRIEPGGPCVPVSRCTRPECGPNESFRACGPACERCVGLPCRMISCDHRCYCAEGHLRDEEGRCVPRADCPQRSRCSRNEEWSESGRADEYCLREEGREPDNRTQELAGCYCRDGFERNAFGSCVRTDACTGRCFGLLEYHRCVPRCNATCHSSDPGCEEGADCFPGCFCPDGHRMDEFNRCRAEGECTEDIPDVKIVRGPGLMVEEPGTTETSVGTSDGPTGTTPLEEDLANEDI